MIRYFIFGLVLTVGIVGWQLFSHGQNKAANDQTGTEVPELAQRLARSTTQTEEITPQRATTPNSAQESRTIAQPQSLRDAAQEVAGNAWQEDTSAPEPPKRFSNKGIAPIPLKISRQHIAQAAVGDTLTLPIPQVAQDFDMSVQQVGKHANGDKTLKGHLTNQPEYAVVVTQGQRSTYATVNTPEGSFLLEADQEQGWLMAATDLDGLIDPNLADYQIPDINRTPN